MKALQIFSLSILFFVFGCSKQGDNVKFNPEENSIIGKWTYAEQFYSTGSPGQWYPVIPANQTIKFKPNGTFIATESFLKGATHFEFIDRETIKFYPLSTLSGFILMRYTLKEAGRELYLQPVDPICIEGCSSKFKR